MLSVLLSTLCPPVPLKSLTFWRYTNQIIIIIIIIPPCCAARNAAGKRAASPPHMDGWIVFTMCCQCAPPCSHTVHASLDSPESTTQTASRSVQLFLQGSLSWQTDHATYSVCSSRPHLRT